METTTIKIQIILGSIREGRFGDKPAYFVLGEVQKMPGVVAELVDLRDYPLPLFHDAVSPSMSGGNYGTEEAKRFAAKIGEADAYVIVTPEYNHGYPGALKNALDSIFFEWNNKPVAFVAYGSVGGARSVEQLRQVAIELQMAPIRFAVHIPWDLYMTVVKETAPADPAFFEPLHEKTAGMLQQLFAWAIALKALR